MMLKNIKIWLPTLITAVALIVGAALWAAESHNEIREDLMAETNKNTAGLSSVRTQTKSNEKSIDRIEAKVDRIEEKIDLILERL